VEAADDAVVDGLDLDLLECLQSLVVKDSDVTLVAQTVSASEAHSVVLDEARAVVAEGDGRGGAGLGREPDGDEVDLVCGRRRAVLADVRAAVRLGDDDGRRPPGVDRDAHGRHLDAAEEADLELGAVARDGRPRRVRA
jgi:hypothetical protein